MSQPKISVLIPSYNRPELLVPTVRSVLGQTARSFEVIVSDDASPRAAEIAAALAQFSDDERFKLVLQPRNLGWSNNRNALLAAARGDFVLLLGDDDLLPAGALARLSAHLEDHPESQLVAFGYEVVDFEGNHLYTRHAPRALALQVAQGDGWREVFYYDVLPMWAFHPFTLCCRRTLALELGYDPRCGIGDDVLFLFQALDRGNRIDVLPEVLFCWRRALKPTRGYINLSSSRAANDKARRAIWVLAQATEWRDPRVRALISSEKFAQHFLGLPAQLARTVADLGRKNTPEALQEAKTCWESLPPDQHWQAGKISKLDRMYRLGGLGYVWFALLGTWRLRRSSSTTQS